MQLHGERESILDLLERACGERPSALHRARSNNPVYLARFKSCARILKLGVSDQGAALRKEHRLFQLLESRGIPVPLVEHIDFEDHPSAVCYMITRSSGAESLLDLLRRDAAHASIPQLCHSMGELLGRIHRISLPQSGMITENDIVPFDTATFVDATYAWAHILIDLRYLTSQDFDHLRRFPIPDIHGHSLCHGDYHAAQCIVSQGMITAVIDWEAAFAADRRVDYAVTSTYLKLYGNQSLVGHFERGYATHWQYDPSVSDQFRSIRLISWLNMMKAWHSRGEVFWNELMQNGRITRVVALLREEARLV